MRELRIGWEFHPNQSRATMHCDRKLFKYYRLSCFDDKLTEDEKRLVSDLEELHGVSEVHINFYQVNIQRAAVFDWSEITPRVEHVVSAWLGASEINKVRPEGVGF